MNHAHQDGNPKVETESEEAGIYPVKRIVIAEDQHRRTGDPRDQSSEDALHAHALPKKTKDNPGKELRYAGVSQQQQRYQR